ncbi:hypothetical protein V2A60_008759 [Cordyceps javanica]
MAKKDTIKRTSGAARLKRRHATEQSPAAPGHGGTNQLSYPMQQSRQQHHQLQMPPETNVSAPSSSRSGPQSDHFMYGSEPPPAADSPDAEEDETGSEASLADNENEPGLAVAVMALASEHRNMTTELRNMSSLLRKLLDAVKENNNEQTRMRAAALLHTESVNMFVEWHKLNNMPNISPMPGFVGAGPATFAHRNQQQEPPDQGGSGQGFGPNVMYNGS